MIKLQGFAPDLDKTTPGILQSATNALPTINGMMGAPTPVNSIWILDGASRGITSIETLSNGTKTYAGQGNYLYELVGAGLSLVGTGWATGTGRIVFTSFGDAVLACNGSDGVAIAGSTGGSFTSISGAPKAKIVESVGLFVLAFGTTYGGTTSPDGWHSCALGNYANWTPSAATQSANGRLLDSAGEITAARRINDGIIAYKKRSMYYGQYVGGDVIWQWSQVATNVGCVGQDAVVNAGGVHYFVGADDLYTFDGSYPRSIGGNIKRWFFKDADPARLKNIVAAHDRNDDHVWFWYSSKTAASGFMDSAIIYNMLTGAWGRVSLVVQDVVTHQSGTDILSVVAIESPYYRVKTLSGACGAASMQTWDIGDDDQYSRLSKVRPRYLTSPTIATATHYHKTHVGLAYTTGTTDTMSDHKFNFGQSARWHRLKIDTVGDFEISGLTITESVQNGNK